MRVGVTLASRFVDICISARARSGNCHLFLSLESLYELFGITQFEYGTKWVNNMYATWDKLVWTYFGIGVGLHCLMQQPR